MAPPPMLQAPKSTKNEISASADVMFGQGQVSLPLGYSLNKAEGSVATSQQGAFTVPRSSVYFGGTLSYSYGQAWFVDLSIAHGNSSGSQVIPTGFLGDINSTFSIDDTLYQLDLKYTFPQLRGKRFSAYLSAGVGYVTATLNDNSPGNYTQTDNTQDYLGNVGVGLSYSLYTTHKWRVDLQGEIEGFGGVRHQQSLETLPGQEESGITPVTADIDNTLYGGIGRATIHGEYRMGKTGLFKVFGDVGIEGRYDIVNYSDSSTSSPNEYLWGPYLKLGLRYDF
ncbi:MAG TPA: autotransporter outer membrane beta-barrel domain-containing protein [Pseudomonadales bacterium]|nr:autotransporter outer membrane beta-barrel domain-containing protein [Pseudomonadales bacterium]